MHASSCGGTGRGVAHRGCDSGQARVPLQAPGRSTDHANLLTENANLHD
ncbi:hypothetical protein [Aquipseudomonas alcaligenes]|uniref:Uncharacterized protein n=1 Tax=Aquipseudomonas alcaligenes TaxID=43263 RepID=A0AA42N432_AQUAC|nr:hypothetical protein [Pseudomonas alcaligenes]MDH0142459.1 hypothetical protein [Pseudomonas alcaligenes]MDH1055972.1 hypothetical protein [Pseudomonas alcaligenes]